MNLTVKERNYLIELIRIQLNDTYTVLNHVSNGKFDISIIDICKKNIEPYSDRIILIEGAVCDYDGNITFYPINQKKNHNHMERRKSWRIIYF